MSYGRFLPRDAMHSTSTPASTSRRPVSVCLSVCLSVRHTRFVTLVYCSQTAKDIIKLFSAA